MINGLEKGFLGGGSWADEREGGGKYKVRSTKYKMKDRGEKEGEAEGETPSGLPAGCRRYDSQ